MSARKEELNTLGLPKKKLRTSNKTTYFPSRRNLLTLSYRWRGTPINSYVFLVAASEVALLKPKDCGVFHHISSSFNPFLGCTIDFGAGVEKPFGCLVIQNRQAVHSMVRSMAWTVKGDIIDGIFFCAILTSRRNG